jgi:hypothetical protein
MCCSGVLASRCRLCRVRSEGTGRRGSIADVFGFAEWLLRDTPGPNGAWTGSELEAAIGSEVRQDI